MKTAPPGRYFLITCPGTASHLIRKTLNLEEQPDVALSPFHGGYFFLPGFVTSGKIGAREQPMSEWTEEQIAALKKAYQRGLNQFMDYTNSAQACGKIAFVKEHANMFFGPTTHSKVIILSQPSALTTPSIFVIRHPALMFPSFERNVAKILGVFDDDAHDSAAMTRAKIAERCAAMTFNFTLSMYNYYADLLSKRPPHNGVHRPLIIDADDVMKEPALATKLASLMNMDATKTRFARSKTSEEEASKISGHMKVMLSTLLESDGIIKYKMSDGIDMDVESKKWCEEFGEETGKDIEQRVRDAMPDYEFLKSKRMLPEMK
ncbi:hypothetical protein HYFRA_00012074 [Hymenoscyphus fraxineus]|uniref:Sulfotransferase domain-containing protein n=1 Tax=Hymenoscyphus fraxineus TaxID=746836 RepID=A0A9N9L359_9HELO|nr:hypothetical protein HYFRA_00012074 [Hymenoscyphus fraxineus]